MKPAHAVWKDGQIVPTDPIDWPDGTSLTITPIAGPMSPPSDHDPLDNGPGSIARWIAIYKSLPALEMTEAEEADWQATRSVMTALTLKRMRTNAIELDVPEQSDR